MVLTLAVSGLGAQLSVAGPLEDLRAAGAELYFADEMERPESIDQVIWRNAKGENLALLSGVKSLKSLHFHESELSAKSLDVLSQLTELEWLDFEDVPIDEAAMQKIDKCLSLKTLAFTRCGLTGKELRHLKSLENVEHVVVCGDDIEEGGFVFLREMPKLRQLEIGDSQVRALDLKYVATLDELGTLVLSGVKFTDEAARDFLNLKNLKYLSFEDSEISESQIQFLEKNLPNLLLLPD